MGWWNLKKDIVPFTAMAAVEGTTVGLHTLYKAAHSKGMNYFVYMTYSFSLGTLLLLPLSFICSRRELPPLKQPVLYRLVLLSLIGFSARILGYKGLEYSSPALASAFSTLTPAFTFILAVIFRMEILDLRSSSTQAKILGTIVSVSGAIVAVLYKGPTLISFQSTTVLLAHSLKASQTNWAVGGLLLAADHLLSSSFYIVQAQVLKMYPAELIVSFMYCLCVTIITIPVSFIAEREKSVWRLRPDITLVSVIYGGFFGPSFISTIHSLCLPLKGPLYISIFKPFSIVIAAFVSVIFLGDALNLGSVVGAIILLLGFYAVLWGKGKEQKTSKDCGYENLGASPSGKTPLLQSLRDEKYIE